jgi:hypothetical protein
LKIKWRHGRWQPFATFAPLRLYENLGLKKEAYFSQRRKGAKWGHLFLKGHKSAPFRLSPQINMTIRAGADERKSSGVGDTGGVRLNEAHSVRRFVIECHNPRTQSNKRTGGATSAGASRRKHANEA